MRELVTFGEVWDRVRSAVREVRPELTDVREIWFLRNLMGRVSLVVTPEEDTGPFLRLGEVLFRSLNAHAHFPERALLVLEREEREKLRSNAISISEDGVQVYLVDLEVTGRRWAMTSELPGPPRFVLFGLKGGLGRSTTAAVLATSLAQKGHRVLLMDFDLESPALSSLLEPEDHPSFGIVEWLVEDLVDQGDALMEMMIGYPNWSVDFTGRLMVVPAYGRTCREHIPQLGRAYLDKFPRQLGEPAEKWVERIRRLIRRLEQKTEPSVVILDSRNGIHDIAAALVAGLPANVLMFAVDSEPTWNGYRILFQHWATYGLIRQIRERLYLVAALVPPVGQEEYLRRFQEHSYDLFAEYLYDETPPEEGEWFSFDQTDETAPHTPFPVYWERGLLAWANLRSLDSDAVQSAYRKFLEQFGKRMGLEEVV
ncbi:MAG: P-loop NTPase [Anaerolineae bacterium]|nr:P-loop NTPase [Anaerolineae bacterium]